MDISHIAISLLLLVLYLTTLVENYPFGGHRTLDSLASVHTSNSAHHLSTSVSSTRQNFRKGRRNNKYLAAWAKAYRPYRKRKRPKPGHATSSSASSSSSHVQNSPITYIKLPATPYNYVPGQGYVSRPASAGMGLMNILSSVMLSSDPK